MKDGSDGTQILGVNVDVYALGFICFGVYSRSPKVGNPMTSILKSNVKGIPALFGLNPVSNILGLTVPKAPCTFIVHT